MKALHLGLGALAALCAAETALAQSSVTVFGVVDTTIQHIRSSSGSVSRLGTGGINGSRLGFKGTEDLGGGLAAGFHLEAGLNTDTGEGRPTSNDNVSETDSLGMAFNRRATVSLLGSLGEVRLGRDYTPVSDNHTDFDVFGNSGVGDSSLLTQSLAIGLAGGVGVRTDVRASNAVVYVLPPDLGGIWGYAMYALGETLVGDPRGYRRGDGSYRGARIGYDNGSLNAALAYGVNQLSSQGDLDNLHFGATYKWGDAQLFGQLSRERTTVDGVSYTNDAAALGVQYALDAQLFKAQVVRNRIRRAGIEPMGATMFALGYQYDLSKRTALQAVISHIRNDAQSSFDLGLPTWAGSSVSGVQAGIRHSF
ncbi:porin [Variovorax sp. J22R133]|uniref:porin n=1 Tax=Variovorax brevis TaxID=3053503 RepID=UPI002576F566|nr:porin [Variovorax sp. J22R133]MDM0115531.1 porin [Variovorax sp. J22R133]